MAQRLTPSEPGADFLDDAIGRLRAMKTTVGLVLARALEAAHSRFLVFGSTLATLAGKVDDLERRDNISWPALEDRLVLTEARLAKLDQESASVHALAALEQRVAGIRTPIEQAARLDILERELTRELTQVRRRNQFLEDQRTDEQVRAGLHYRSAAATVEDALDTLELLRRRWPPHQQQPEPMTASEVLRYSRGESGT